MNSAAEFYKVYRPIQKRYSLKADMYFDTKGNNQIRIYQDSVKGKICIIRVEEEEKDLCYTKAIQELRRYDQMRYERAKSTIQEVKAV